jgi:hypothetical protein
VERLFPFLSFQEIERGYLCPFTLSKMTGNRPQISKHKHLKLPRDRRPFRQIPDSTNRVLPEKSSTKNQINNFLRKTPTGVQMIGAQI